MAEGKTPSERLQITVAVETVEYLRALVATGLYGTTTTGVASALIEKGIRDSIESGFIKLRTS